MSEIFKRARLLIDNHTLTAPNITVSPTPDTGYEAANLQDPDRTRLCQVAGSTLTATVQMTGNPWVHALALTGLHFSVSATFRLMGNDQNVWTSPDYDSGEQPAYPAAFPAGAGAFGDYAMGGYITSDVAPYFRPTAVFYLPELKTYSWWRLEIDDPYGSGTVGLGILGLCQMIETPRNFSNGWQITPVDTTTKRRTTSGQLKAGRPGTRFDRVKLAFRHIPDEQKWFLHNKFKELGEITPWFLDMHPKSVNGDGPFTVLYGVTTGYSGLKVHGPGRNDLNFTFEEQPT